MSLTVARDAENGSSLPRKTRKAAAAKVDSGASVANVRRGLSENGGTPAKKRKGPVGRTMVMPTSTLAASQLTTALPDEGCTDYYETAVQCMPDCSEEWRKVLNTKLTAPKWEHKKRVEQQTRLIATLKKCADTCRQQRQVFLDRIAAIQRELTGQLSQLSDAKQGSARADALREEIKQLEAQLEGLEGKTKEAVEKAEAMEAELVKVQASNDSKDAELETKRAEMTEATATAKTAQEDCEREAKRLNDELGSATAAAEELQQSNDSKTAAIKKLEQDAANAASTAEKQQEAHEKKMAAAQEERKAAAEAATESEAEVAKLKAMEIDRESNLSSEQTTLEKCRSAMEEAKGTADRTEEELAGQEKDCARLQEEVGGLKTKQQALTEETATLNAQKDKLQEQSRELSKELADTKDSCEGEQQTTRVACAAPATFCC